MKKKKMRKIGTRKERPRKSTRNPTGYAQSITIFYLERASERGKVERREASDWNKRGKASRQMLNGACKYHERRDTKGAPKRSGVRADKQAGRQAGGRERWGEKGAMYAVGSSCAGPEG